MGKNFVVGDIHGNTSVFSKSKFPLQADLTKDDVVFQLGDFGVLWYYPESLLHFKDDELLNDLAAASFSLFVIPGNHENYDLINALPIVEKWGSPVFVLHLEDGDIFFAKRGEVYTVNAKTIFTFSGAKTFDADRFSLKDLDQIRQTEKYGRKIISIDDINYWEGELATKEEREHAIKNLSEHNYKVDFIFTHTAPRDIINEFIFKTDDTEGKFSDPTVDFLDNICELVEFKEWHYGHMHHNYSIKTTDGLFVCHFDNIPQKLL